MKVDAKTLRYLSTSLRRNPIEEAETIVRDRRRFLGVEERESEPARSEETIHARRMHAREKIDRLRDEFWTMPLAHLKAAIEGLDVGEFPELRPAATRLRVVVTFRPEFVRLAEHKDTDLNLFNAFKKAVVRPPKEAATVKQKFLRWADGSGTVKSCRKMVKSMRRQFPELYELEKDWLLQVEKLKGRATEVSISHDGDDEGGGFQLPIPGWLIIAILIFVFRMLLYLMR